jgi:hypothetical protein
VNAERPDASSVESVLLESGASPDEVAALEAAFARAGFTVTAEAAYERRSAGALPWVVLIIVTIGLGEFVRAFARTLGEEAGKGVAQLLRDILEARRSSPVARGSVQIRAGDGTMLTVSTETPEEGLDAIAEIDFEAKLGHYLLWDHERREWRDPTRD